MEERLTKAQKDKILTALDDVLADKAWKSSPFLGLIGQKIQLIREEFERNQQLDEDEALYEGESRHTRLSTPNVEQYGNRKKVFISLYTSSGTNLQSWEQVISHLPHQAVSRPVYAEEADVVAIMRSKSNLTNEAYVSFYVDPKFILTPASDRVVLDKLGKPLLNLKDKALSLDYLQEFVHTSGVYRFTKGHLVKK